MLMHPVTNDHRGTPSLEKPLNQEEKVCSSQQGPAELFHPPPPPLCLLDGCRSPPGVHGVPETPGQPSRYQMGQVLLSRGSLGQDG